MIQGRIATFAPSASRTIPAPAGWFVNTRMASAWVWSTNRCGRNACSSVSTDGVGADASSKRVRTWLTISSSLSRATPRSRASGASTTAGSPAGSIVARSQPLPLTQSTSIGSPCTRSVTVVLTDVLPPPWSTSVGSAPISRDV